MTIPPRSLLYADREQPVEPSGKPEHDTESDCRAVLSTLLASTRLGRQWIIARDLVEMLGWEQHENNHRRIRDVAEQERKSPYPRILSFPGSPGYCATEAATIEEVRHAQKVFIALRGSAEAGIRGCENIIYRKSEPQPGASPQGN